MARVIRCRFPRITEAWCRLLGEPAEFDGADAAVLRRLATRTFGELESRPGVVTHQIQSEVPAAPFWTEQVAWDDGPHLARFGHQYLSVHVIPDQLHPYTTFDGSLRQPIRRWLDVFAEFGAFARGGDIRIAQVGFGYLNAFEFPSDEFDLSRYFRLNFAVDVPGAAMDLLGAQMSFRFSEPQHGAMIHLQVKADAGVDESAPVVLRTSAIAEIPGGGLASSGPDALEDAVYRAKELAKARFFALATPETHELMGVVTDAGD